MKPYAELSPAYQKRIDSYIRRTFPGLDIETARRNHEVLAGARGHVVSDPKTIEGAVTLALGMFRDPERYESKFNESQRAQDAATVLLIDRPDLAYKALSDQERYGRTMAFQVETQVDSAPASYIIDVEAPSRQSHREQDTTDLVASHLSPRPYITDSIADALDYYSTVPVPVVLEIRMDRGRPEVHVWIPDNS